MSDAQAQQAVVTGNPASSTSMASQNDTGTDPNAETDASTDDAATDAAPGSKDAGIDPALDDEGRTLTDAQKNLRDNLRESSVDGLQLRTASNRDEAPGIDLGAFTFRPSLSEGVGIENTTDTNGTNRRSFIESTLKGSLTSDWSSHELVVKGEATKQSTLSGIRDDDPQTKLDATLKLDLMDDTVASLKAGFSRSRETTTDTNALPGATLQATVTNWSTGTEVIHDFGRIRATLGADFVRQTYGPAVSATGKTVSQSDRNADTLTLRSRLGYEVSPALIPFIEASYAEMLHDQNRDRDGYRRDLTTIGGEAGVELDLGDKLKGELAGGYSLTRFADARLADIAAITVNGNANWSPQRGTNVSLGLGTTVEPATISGVNGAVSYALRGEVSQEVLHNVTARATLSTTWRDYRSNTASDETVIVTGAGLTWGLSRYLDLTGDAEWETTRADTGSTTSVLRGLVGLTLKR